MRRTALITLVALFAATSAASGGGRLHGTVTTRDGERVTGTIRWDKNENYWDDFLDASKTDRVRGRHEEGLNLRIFGLRILRSSDRARGWTRSQFSIPFGHIAAIEPRPSNRALCTLKNGEELELVGSGDLGSSMRGIVVTETSGRELEIDWSDLDRVEFTEPSSPEGSADRLYGRLETSIGNFTGFVVWDKDEALLADELDGRSQGKKLSVPFARIREIERAGSKAARVTLNSGEILRLSGTNDVNDDNRGIEITIEEMGKVTVGWEDFERLVLETAPPSPGYAAFDGGRALVGTVTTADGREISGEIVWDRDEAHTWECLDGEIRGVAFEILFKHIASIERASRSSATVRLTDGTEFVLRDSNDVNHRNKGIVVRPKSGETVEIDWSDFRSAVFPKS